MTASAKEIVIAHPMNCPADCLFGSINFVFATTLRVDQSSVCQAECDEAYLIAFLHDAL